MLLAGVAIVTVGSTIWGLIFNMEDDMNEMNVSMAQMKGDMRDMASVIGTMQTMGDDVHEMGTSVAAMSRDLTSMALNVGLISTMTPAVQRMSTDTNSMQRDMHWIMPFNWMPKPRGA